MRDMRHTQQHIHDSYCSKDSHPDINDMILELIVEGYLLTYVFEIIMKYKIHNGIPMFDLDFSRYNV